MMAPDAGVDTSIIVRYLTGSPPDLFARSQQILDSEVLLSINPIALVESAHVLTSFYRIPREAVVDSLIDLVRKVTIQVQGMDEGTVILALLMCRPSGRVSFADAIIWGMARTSGTKVIYSFDKKFPADGLLIKDEL